MNEQENVNETKNLKFYSQKSIGLATFIGGPLASGYLIRENYLSLNKPDEGKKALFIGIIATIVIFGGIFMLPEAIIDKLPNQLLPLIYTGIIYLIVEKIHGTVLNQHKENGNEFFSGWKAAGIGFISLIILAIGIFGYIYLSPDGAEIEKYNIEFSKFSKNETESLIFYDHLKTESDSLLIQELNNVIIPKWKENIKIINRSNEIKDLPIEYLEQNKMLLKYSELRIETFELFKKAINDNTGKYVNELDRIHIEIDEQLKKLND